MLNRTILFAVGLNYMKVHEIQENYRTLEEKWSKMDGIFYIEV